MQCRGVCQRASGPRCAQIVARGRLADGRQAYRGLQFHGEESADYCRGWDMQGDQGVSLERKSNRCDGMENFPADFYLLDSWSAGYGGSGAPFPWEWLDGIDAEQAHSFRRARASTMSPRRFAAFVPTESMFAAAWKRARVLRIMGNSKNSSLPPKVPDRRGHFGPYGGRYVAETLMPALTELERAYAKVRRDPRVSQGISVLSYASMPGRETPLYFAERLTQKLGGAKIYLKREDLCHTGAHKINNTIGQILLARRMGKKRIIAETGAGQHGVATATVAARFGLECEIFMGKEDVAAPVAQCLSHEASRRQGAGGGLRQPDVEGRHERSAARLGDQRAHDLLSHRLGGRAASLSDDGARLSVGDRPGSAPADSRQRRPAAGLSGRLRRRRQQLAWGSFYPFVRDRKVKMIGVEAAGRGLRTGKHAASILGGEVGVLHGSKSYVLQDDKGQIRETHSVAAGLDYPGVGPELSYLRDRGRVRVRFGDRRRSDRGDQISRRGRRHHSGFGERPRDRRGDAAWRRGLRSAQIIIVNLSGRGDKDMMTVGDYLGVKL